MKTIFKLIPILLLVGTLSACGNDESKNDNTNESNKHASNKSDSSKKDSDNKDNTESKEDDEQKTNKIELHDYMNSSKKKIMYRVATNIYGEPTKNGDQFELKDVKSKIKGSFDKDGFLDKIVAVQNGKTRQFKIEQIDSASSITGKIKYTFNECLKYDTDKLMDKFDHYEDKHSDRPSKFIEPRKAARLDEEGNISTASYLFGQKDTGHSYDKDANNREYKELKEALKKNNPSYSSVDDDKIERYFTFNTSIKPFEYKGQYYSGLAYYSDAGHAGTIERLLLVPVDHKNDQIVLDDKNYFDKDEIIDYKDTDKGEKEKKEKEDELDNL
ncbi:hypothetical protein [Staphylococcus pettenkoferi]|uniref:hypothetical protein n=1 Tax=Staphylococcus pettenkoferi TaxID=170573 RepID=UPI001F5730BB|nr:hypothetical protein [Staphylococcus pettenkoferi]MCI2802806.1 hypothetical protein [Staphylococcus pettenkoferi]